MADDPMETAETPADSGRQTMSDVEEVPPSVTDWENFANKIMPDLGYEVEDFQYNTWSVNGWKSLEKKLTGPEFECGGYKWRILLFPFGNNNTDSVSIYLEFAKASDEKPGWHVCVQFALVLWNSADPMNIIQHSAHHRFTAEESDWGFTRFHDIHKLFERQDNRSHPLIENESTNITAFVRVLKDPTGVLWHNFINYDSKKETGYVGLKNQGATCYMNSLLQSLYCTNYFRKAVYQIPTESDEPTKSVSLALQRVFYQLQTSGIPVGTTELTKSFGWDSLDSFMQHDVQEFNRVLQDNLEGKMKNTQADGAITKLFVGKMKSYVKCVNVDYESSRVEDYYDIQLNVKGCKTLRDAFKDYIQEETLEGDNRYAAEGYGLQEAKKGIIFESFPPVLHLHLKRFEYDLQRDALVKINDRYEFPMEMDLEEFLSPDADRSVLHKYLLHGVLVHSGDVHGGHYFALLKPEKSGKWLKFDDDRVTPVTEKEVLEDNYGGEQPNSSPIPALRPGLRNPKRFTNAYMLVYIRESAVDDVLAPVLNDDIPEHLQRRLEEEKAALEQKKKEREEMHLYLTVKLITDETFKTHQGFDLANFEDKQYPLTEVRTLKVAKAETYGQFKERIAQEYNVPPERARLWVLVNRQNKTIRPDAPIPESSINTTMEEVHTKMTARNQNELKLYLEIADKPVNDKTWFPPTEGNAFIMIFLKYFDPDQQMLEGLGHLYIQKFAKVGEIAPTLCEKKGLPPGTHLKIYEEIKPTMIDDMKLKSTFQQSEIQDGDIICFQKALNEKEISEHIASGRYPLIPQFYEHLTLRIVVQFKPKFRDREAKPEFSLVLDKKMNYDQVAEKVAEQVGTEPLKLRFTTSHAQNGTPKAVIRRTAAQNLAEMLQPGYLGPPSTLLYYEMLEISIVEWETKKFLKIHWLGSTVKDEQMIEVRLPKNATVQQIIDHLQQDANLSVDGRRIRVYEVVQHKIHKEYTGQEPINIIAEYATLYAEEIPEEELERGPNDRVVQVYHFCKDPGHQHGIPFKFVIKADETFADTKKRLQARLGMNDKDFTKVRVAIVSLTSSYTRPTPVEEDGHVLSEHKWGAEDLLGLDHLDKSNRSRAGAHEKAIYIRG